MSFHTEAQFKLAAADVLHGIARYQLWMTLGWHDIRQKFRRSILGPFWLTLSTAFVLVALGFVYAAIFKMQLREYFPYLAAGVVTWTLISGLISEGCQTFIAVDGLIKQIRLPFTTHACRVVWRNFIVFLHNVVIIFVVGAIFDVWPSPASLGYLILGLALIMVNGVWLALLLGLVSARFRDIPPIVSSLLQLVFFLTPIIWHPSLLPGRRRIVEFNPFYHFVEMVRGPLLNQVPAENTWLTVVAITVIGWAMTFAILLRGRRRIAYWL